MHIYDTEKADGLADALSLNSVKYLTVAKCASTPKNIERLIAESAKVTNRSQFDLHYLEAILATIDWNDNDDVFDRDEVWAAKDTPSNKMFNMGHNEKDVIGHVLGSYVLNKDLELYNGDTPLDYYHLGCPIILYKYWQDEKLQDRMNKVIAEIKDGLWFISLEALFENFDYGIITASGERKVIKRDAQSCWLTKKLRAYGGNGQHEDYRVGRLLRDITFRGAALVENPANRKSIILKSDAQVDIDTSNSGGVKLNNEIIKENKIMSDNLEAKLAQANEEIKSLTKQLAEGDAKKLKEDNTALEQTVASLKEQVQSLKTELDKSKENLTSKSDELVRANTNVDTLTKELSEVKAAVKTAERVNKLIAAGVGEEDAKKKAAALANTDDAVFAMFVEMLPKQEVKVEAAKTEKTEADKDEDDASKTEVTVEDNSEADLSVSEDTEDSELVLQQAIASYLTNEDNENGE